MTRSPEKIPVWAWLAPPVVLSVLVFTLAVDVFHWDEWVIWGEMLHKLETDTFDIVDLAAQQNEQRNLAARLFGLLLMPVFKLNRFAEYGLNIALAGIGMLAAVHLYTRTSGDKASPHVWLVFSLFSFSLMQWEAFTFGANSSVIVLPAGLWLGLFVAQTGPPTPLRLATLGIIGILPSFSFANGLFYWFCLLPVISYKAHRKGVIRSVLGAWLIMTATAWLLYFHTFQSPGHHPPFLNGLAHPLQLLGYFLAYLGGGVSSDKNLFPLAIVLGLFSLPLFTTLAYREWRAGKERRAALLPWLGAALFSLSSAGVTALARSPFGIEQALESRYASFSTPYWIALCALIFTEWQKRPDNKNTSWFLAGVLAVFSLSTVLSGVVVYNRHEPFALARQALFSLTDETALETIFPDSAYLMMQLPTLIKKRLSVYRDIPVINKENMLPGTGGEFNMAGPYAAAQGRIPGIMVEGVSPKTGESVLLTAEGRVVAYLPKTGDTWRLFLPMANLPGGKIRLKGYLATKNGLTPLEPLSGIEVERSKPGPVVYTFRDYFFIKDMTP